MPRPGAGEAGDPAPAGDRSGMNTPERHSGDGAGPGTPDDRLGRLVQAGDREAFREAYRRYSPALTRLVLHVTGNVDAAADVVQEVFERLWCRPERFDPERGLLRGFLAVSARTAAIDTIRRDDARRRRENVIDLTDAARDLDHSEHRATVATVRAALAALPERELAPIVLAYWTELTYRDVAVALDIPEGTVKSRIRSGLRRLATLTEVRIPPSRSGQALDALDHEGQAEESHHDRTGEGQPGHDRQAHMAACHLAAVHQGDGHARKGQG